MEEEYFFRFDFCLEAGDIIPKNSYKPMRSSTMEKDHMS